jgi:hypothetical protein
MRSVIISLLVTLRTSLRTRVALQPEILALRHQLQVLERTLPRRVRVNERGLSRMLTRYPTYYHQSRTHLALAKDAPRPRPIAPPALGPVIATPHVGGLHHRYDRRAA